MHTQPRKVTVRIGDKIDLGSCICCANVMADPFEPTAEIDMGERLSLRMCRYCAFDLVEKLNKKGFPKCHPLRFGSG